jgi:chemotaxis protein histidine kinase CheA
MSTTLPPTATNTRLILTRVADQTLAFPSTWVSEIFQTDRKQVLPMPFYGPLMLGMLHHNSQVVPLILGDRLLGNPSATVKEVLTVIQLSRTVNELVGVGIVVEQILGSTQVDEIEFVRSINATATDAKGQTIIFNTDLIPEALWQPQRWKIPS